MTPLPPESENPPARTSPFGSYEEAEGYLCLFTDYEKMVKGTRYPDDLFDLCRIRRLLERLGNPHLGLRGIHIAGTKGKGSTAAFAEAILSAHGLSTGLFTSPHLIHKEERIRVRGEMLRRDEFLHWMNVMKPSLEELKESPQPPTFFDILTTAAFLHFSFRSVQASVIEVGLGGRLDSTNVFCPDVAVITRLGLDHTEKLGNSVDLIAAEKAGIVKPGVPVISHPQEDAARPVLERKCREMGSSLLWVGEQIEVEAAAPASPFTVRTPGAIYPALTLCVLGEHQMVNAAAALAAAEIFLERREGRRPDPELVREALSATRQPGRIEVLSERPWLVVDVAHNPLSIEVLLRTVRNELVFEDLHVLFACASDKDVQGMVTSLAVHANRWTLTSFDFPRIESPSRILGMIRGIKPEADVRITEDPDEALADAFHRSGPRDCILCCGSFYLAGEIFQRIPEPNTVLKSESPHT